MLSMIVLFFEVLSLTSKRGARSRCEVLFTYLYGVQNYGID